MKRFQQAEPVDEWFRVFSEKWEAHFAGAAEGGSPAADDAPTAESEDPCE